ncbi:ML domain protein, partial [Opisthorchis viverrini]
FCWRRDGDHHKQQLPLSFHERFGTVNSTFAADEYNFARSRNVQILSVGVNPCNSSEPCVLFKGETASINITFKAEKDIVAGDAVVQGIYNNQTIPLPFPDKTVCSHLTPQCPIKEGKTYSFSHTHLVSQDFQLVSLEIRWELLDSDKMPFVCVQFPVQIDQTTIGEVITRYFNVESLIINNRMSLHLWFCVLILYAVTKADSQESCEPTHPELWVNCHFGEYRWALLENSRLTEIPLERFSAETLGYCLKICEKTSPCMMAEYVYEA